MDELEALIAHGPVAVGAAGGPVTIGMAIAAALDGPSVRPWRALARPEQLAVADSSTMYTFLLGGRGMGKTWTAANTLVERALSIPAYYAIVAPTFSDCRALCVEGPSGVLRALGAPTGDPGGGLVRYDKSKYELHLVNGSVLVMASDEAPSRLRGPNFTGVWCDEVGSYKKIKATWEEGVEFSTRIGAVWKLLTGTPKRGHPLVKEFHDRGVAGDPDVTLVRGRTEDNVANLSPEFLRTIRAKYQGTTLGRQELDGLLLPDAEGALVTSSLVEATRVRPEWLPELHRVVVGVDPAVTDRDSSDHTGIIVAGIGGPPLPGYLGKVATVAGKHLYFLVDESLRATPREWAQRVLKVAEQWAADAITPEQNNGGDLVSTMLRMVAESDQIGMPRIDPVYATVGKRTRAEPVAGVWEQYRVHVVDALPDLEDQWVGWVPGDPGSPDQFDASVWGAVFLMPELAVKAQTRVRVLTGNTTQR